MQWKESHWNPLIPVTSQHKITGMKAHLQGSDVLWCLGHTAALRSLWGNRSPHASEGPDCRSVMEQGASLWKKWNKCKLSMKIITPNQKLTLKHSSVAKSLAMEHRETASQWFSCSALAASRTSSRDATNLVAISASLNWRNYTQNGWEGLHWYQHLDLSFMHACIKRLKTSATCLVIWESLSKLLAYQQMISC